MYSNILITGGAGFVGSNLAIAFKKDFPKSKIIAIDNLKRRGSELNLPRLRKYGIEFIHGDIRNPEDMDLGFSFELIIECSAEPSVLAGYNSSPAYLINSNLMGTVNCLELARKNRADMVFLSSSRVYPIKTINNLKYHEDSKRFLLDENQDIEGVSAAGISEKFPLNSPRSLYGTTKLASEMLLAEYIDMYNLRGIINRCGVLTGPWQMGKIDQGVVVLWIARHFFGGKLAYLGYGGQGKQVRDILHVNDLFDLIKLQLKDIDQHNGEIYNVGGGFDLSLSLKELTEICVEIIGKEIQIGSISQTRKGDIPYYITDYRKVKNTTGWFPKVSKAQIMDDIYTWIKENEKELQPVLLNG